MVHPFKGDGLYPFLEEFAGLRPVNLAMGAKDFPGVGHVDADSPDKVEFQIERISAYQIDSPAERTAVR
jgi:hypothetical protein